MTLTPRELGQRRRRQREEATGTRPQGPRLAEYSLRTFAEEWAPLPWSECLRDAESLAWLVRVADGAGFKGTRRATLEQRLRAVMAQGED